MAANIHGKRIAQICVYGALAVGLVVTVASGPLGKRLIGSEAWEPSQWKFPTFEQAEEPHVPDDEERGHSRRRFHDEASMPAYHDARENLRRLNQAKTRLLNAAAEDDVEQLQAAGAEYRLALQETRNAIGRLKDRVEPNVYGDLLRRLMMERGMHSLQGKQFPMPELQIALPHREARQ